jgi:hypothetical protein
MSDNPPQYGERVPGAQKLPITADTKIVNHAATNEHDATVARENTKRSVIRTLGTVVVVAILMLPLIIGASRAVI